MNPKWQEMWKYFKVSVEDPGQIDEIFDAISYDKGASIIHMLYHWIGHEAFKVGCLKLFLFQGRIDYKHVLPLDWARRL